MIHPAVQLVSWTPEPLQHIERMGRIAYGSAPSSDVQGCEEWIRKRLRGWELDVLEHASTTWTFTLSRIAAQQYTRHRLAAYTMESQRFREVQEEDLTLVPPECKIEDVAEWLADMHAAYLVYRKWRDKGYHKQAARYHLPGGAKTILSATWNFRELLHILHMRRPNMAEPEVQHLANAMHAILSSMWPCVFEEDIAA